MPGYRLAKAAEHALNLEWVRQQIIQLRAGNLPHTVLLDRLELKLADDAQVLRWLESAVGTPGMEIQANSLSQILATNLRGMSEHYIAGLLHQSPAELRWREVLIAAIRRLQLTWIDDLLVRLSRDLAVLPAFRGDIGIPVFFAPPNQHETFLSLPGIYHEFGHCVENREQQIIDTLRREVTAFFAAEKLKIGPLPPSLRKTRSDELDLAVVYWDETRLAEIFCDVFAGHACGSANLLSTIDLARASGLRPCSVDHPYPPHATRVGVSYAALTAAQQNQPLVATAWHGWRQFEGHWPKPTRFQVFCPQGLVDLLARVSNNLIAQFAAATPRQTALLPSLAVAQAAQPGDDLEQIVTNGMVVLWETPDDFQVWRARVFAAANLV